MLGAWRPWTTPLVLCSNLRQPKHCLFRPYGSIPTNSEGYSCILSVLDLAGREFLFFTEACMVPSFGFVTKRALITHQCLCCCWTVFTQCQGLLHFSLCPTPVRRLACPKRLGGNAARTADQGDITYRGNTIMLCYNLVVVCHKVPGTGYQCSGTVWTLVGWWWNDCFCIACWSVFCGFCLFFPFFLSH